MYFTAYTPIFPYEVMMRMIPNFLPRGHGMYVFIHSETKEETDCDLCCYYRRKKCDLPTCPFIPEKIKFGTATKKQIMDAVFMNIRSSKFRERLSLFIRESENTNMNYFGKKHESGFNKILERIDSENYKLVSTVFLLTADAQLWRMVQNQVEKNCIRFDKMSLGSVDEKAYTLFCCAKDLYLGTKHITIADLADEQLVSSKMFGIICNALAIRRFGAGVLCEQNVK